MTDITDDPRLSAFRAFIQEMKDNVTRNQCAKCGTQPAHQRGMFVHDGKVYCPSCWHGLLADTSQPTPDDGD